MTELKRTLTKALMPGPQITVTVYTVGGVDNDGNEIDEPVVFDGRYNEAVIYFSNEGNLSHIQDIYRAMPDGYIYVECGDYAREVYDAWEIMDAIEEMR